MRALKEEMRSGLDRGVPLAALSPALLRSCHDLYDDDIAAIESAGGRYRKIGARQDLTRYGDRLGGVLLIVHGWVFRYKLLHDGSKAIVGYLLPGDICDGHAGLLGGMDHGVACLTPAVVLEMSSEQWAEVAEEHPRIARAVERANAICSSVAYEWLLNVGQRTAYHRVAHLICELWERLEERGMTEDNSVEFPLTQHDIGDTLGLTTVHVNRVLQLLRANGLITLEHKRLTMLDKERLQWVGDFNPAYLHLLERPLVGH